MTLLSVDDLHVWFTSSRGKRTDVVRGLNFSLDAGEKLGLVGESGCGKTTTVLTLMGLLPPNATVSGRVLLDGSDVLQGGERSIRPHRWLDVAMVFQGSMNAFNPVRRVNLQIADAISIRKGLSREAGRQRADELLELVGVPRARGRSFPHELSGGMRQRASIALALGCEPRVLLADEPTTALDVIVQAQIMRLLANLCEERGLSLILVSHDLAMVLEMCSRVEVMYGGRIVESAGGPRLFEEASHPYTQLMLASTLYVDDDSPLAIPPPVPQSLDDEADVGCQFRPRCEWAFGRCAVERPLLTARQEGHAVACHRLDADGSELLALSRKQSDARP